MGRHIILGFVLLFLLLLGIAQLGLCGRCIESEKQALLKFKASFHDDSFESLSFWNPQTNCCQWDGITCHNVTGHVLKIDLSDYVLQATGLDPSLLELQYLIYLDLRGINFNAISIPAFLGSMGRLRYLSISGSNFIGKIPTNFLRNLAALQFLDLSWNDLDINDMSWISKLQSLQHLNLSNVYLGEAHNLFQVLHMLPSLSQLQLEGCGLGNLSAPLPPFNFTNNTRVQVLNLAQNEIDGQILDVFLNWTFVEFLDLNSNNLSSMPLWLGEFRNLVSLDLSYNVLYGPIPIALSNLTSLEYLDLSVNNFSSMPLWLGEFRNLVSLDLSSNALCGPIPIGLSNLTSLEYLDLSLNNFSSIPSWLGELRSLCYLHISMNQVTATLEISVSQLLKNMCRLQKLYMEGGNFQGEAFGDSDFSRCIKYDIEELYLRNNRLNGHLPTWLGNLEKLTTLDLSWNYFSGNVPQSLGHLVNLEYLYLSSNSFRGNIPRSLGQLSNLYVLDLSSNSLSGNIPQSLVQLINLKYLDLSNNSFRGNIPQGLCEFVNLTTLDLSHNKFSGEILNCWRCNPQFRISEINFSFNKLSGAFPVSVGELSSLFWLHLNNNHLEGKLPLTLKNLNQLIILDLGVNKFMGSIPSSWTSNTFPILQILRLRDNMLDGNIPSNLCQLGSLQILDLANNNLSGSIPHCIGNLTKMTKDSVDIWESSNPVVIKDVLVKQWYDQHVEQVMKGRELDYTRILELVVNLDLSNNNLVGSVPLELFSLVGLIGLNLSHNLLKGEIPEKIGNMKQLESFDISCNQISGAIPMNVSKLTALNYLNMSYNNLSGPIPAENQFLTLNDPSIYAGNPYLCGTPLSNKCQGDDTHQVPETNKDLEDENGPEKVWFYFVVAIGFAFGFWGVIGTLVLKKNWRYACFRRVEDVADEIYVFTSPKIAKLRRLLTNHVHG
ncbi:receptor-like protein EIX2 [Neltuma alba]|uniref:receptor-like protein EIX2 n=1 Tax=Neltuma alba TaxID=207710 RepID=UPI0010A56E9C|nr:receptor-like protein EIX2 [Prosopis alba]